MPDRTVRDRCLWLLGQDWQNGLGEVLTDVSGKKDLEKGSDKVVYTLYVPTSRMPNCPNIQYPF
jgi:hypothetical protein